MDRLYLYLALAVFAALVISRTGLPQNFETASEVLVFTQWWHDTLEGDALESVIREFEELNPGIRVELRNLSYREIRDGLTGLPAGAAAEGGLLSQTDLIGLDPLWLEDLIRGNRLAPLEEAPREDASSKEDGSGFWAVPLVSFMIPLFYNIEVLKAAGFNRPPKTQGELLELSRTLAAGGKFGLGLALSPENPGGVYREIFPWLWASGAAMIREGKPAFSGRAVTGALEFLDGLRQNNLISPGSFSKTEDRKREEFLGGQIALMAGSVRDIVPLRERMGENGFGITAFPGPELFTGKSAFGITGWYAGISAQSALPAESRAFLSFLREKSSLLAAAARAVPGSGNSPGEYVGGDTLYAKAWDLYEGGDIIEEFNGIPRYRDMEALFRAEFFGLFQGEQTPAQTAQAIQTGWEGLLKE